jgi:SAM-dependent methyltransferase
VPAPHRYEFPTFRHRDFEATARFLEENTGRETRLHSFFRGYFSGSLQRIALNIVFLRGILKRGDRYLDVGSFGIESAVLKRENPEIEYRALSFDGNVIGIDDDGFYETTRFDDRREVRLECRDVEREAFPYGDDTFDVVTCFEVIEHLKFSPIPMLMEIRRVLKPDGVLVLTTPNINSAESIVRMLKGESPQECPLFHRDMKYGVVHPKEYTRRQLHDAFEELGFEILAGTSIDATKPEGAGGVAVRVTKFAVALLARSLGFFGYGDGSPDLAQKLYFVVRKGSEIRNPYPASLFE